MKKQTIAVCALACSLLCDAQNLVPVHNKKGQFGYSQPGVEKPVIKPQWDEARPFNDKGVAIVRKDEKFGFISTNGKPWASRWATPSSPL